MALFSIILSWIPSLLLLLLGVLLLSLLCFVVYIKSLHMKYAHIPGPPIENFIFGHMFAFVQMKPTESKLDTFLEWSVTYGPVYKLFFLHHVIILTTCPETIKKILMVSKSTKHKAMYNGVISLFGRRFLGSGLLTERDHEKWYQQRRVMDPAFSSIALKSYIGTMNEYAEKMMSQIKEAVETDSVVNMTHVITGYALDVFAKIAFDIDTETMKNKDAFSAAVKKCLQAADIQARDVLFQFKSKNKAYVESVRDVLRFLRETGRNWISKRCTAMQNNEQVPKDILTRILKNQTQDEKTSNGNEEILVDNFMTFFVAGQDTTAKHLAFCVRELGRHPDALEKLKKEVDDVIGMRQDITSEDQGKLVYLGQVLKEVLRLYPIGPVLTRWSEEDLVINGLRVPGRVHVMFSSYITSRSPESFKDPLVFDPDHFHPDAPKPYYCYYPFSLGPRGCIGQNLSQMEAKVVMAKLIQRFDFTLTPGQKFGCTDTMILSPPSEVTCFVKNRDTKK